MAAVAKITDPTEPFVRFLFDGHYRKSDMTVKWQAFKPAPDDNRTSIYSPRGLAEAVVWAYGADVATQRGQQLKGRTDFSNLSIIEVNSGLFAEWDPPPQEHACIGGWPEPDDVPEVMALARDLAEQCSKVVPPP